MLKVFTIAYFRAEKRHNKMLFEKRKKSKNFNQCFHCTTFFFRWIEGKDSLLSWKIKKWSENHEEKSCKRKILQKKTIKDSVKWSLTFHFLSSAAIATRQFLSWFLSSFQSEYITDEFLNIVLVGNEHVKISLHN